MDNDPVPAKKPRLNVEILESDDGDAMSDEYQPGRVYSAFKKGDFGAAALSEAAGTSAVSAAQQESSTNMSPPSSVPSTSKVVLVPVPGKLLSDSTSSASRSLQGCLQVSNRQKGNSLLNCIRSVPWEFTESEADFVLGKTTGAIFITIKYHNLHPDYIHTRIKRLGRDYALRILLVLVDLKDCNVALKELNMICLLSDLTLLLAWSNEEAARYIESYKALENKPADLIMEKFSNNYLDQATDFFSTVKSVNKANVAALLTNFGIVEKVINADKESLEACIGLGPRKAERLYSVFHTTFNSN